MVGPGNPAFCYLLFQKKMIRAFALFTLTNALILLVLYTYMILFQWKHNIPGWEVTTSKYPNVEQAYFILNIFALTYFIFAAIASLRSELQIAYIQNFITNIDEKEVNYMMLRTVEIQSTFALTEPTSRCRFPQSRSSGCSRR